jgi:hypothetical protein
MRGLDAWEIMELRQLRTGLLFGLILLVALGVSGMVFRSDGATTATVTDLGFGMGSAAQGLIQHHRLGIPDPAFGWWAYAPRMPLIPVAVALLSVVSDRFGVFFFVKNLVCWTFWAVGLLRLRKHYSIPDKWVLLAAAVVIIVPYNGNIASRPEVEEGYLVAMLGLLYALILTADGPLDAATISALVALIYLTKSSMALICVVSVVWVAVMELKRSFLRAMLPVVGLAIAVLAWGGYIYAMTGVFALGANQSSWNGWNYYKGNNPYALAMYPRVPLDKLDDTNLLIPAGPMRNEWELSDAQFRAGRKFAIGHPEMVLKMDLKKIYVICCDLRESPERVQGQTRLLVAASNLLDHLLVSFCIVLMGIRLWKKRLGRAEILALVLISAYLPPYLAGWVYMRHMVPIYGLFALVLAIMLATSGESQPIRVDTEA